MAFTTQNDSGSIDSANAYITVAFFKTYHKDRGNVFSAGTGAIEDAVIKATDYVDARFRYVGDRTRRAQRTQWPRLGAHDRSEDLVQGIPFEIQEATADLALIALTNTLDPTPTRDDTGRAVESKREKVGPIEEETTYANGGISLNRPEYPVADNKIILAGLTVRGTILKRG